MFYELIAIFVLGLIGIIALVKKLSAPPPETLFASHNDYRPHKPVVAAASEKDSNVIQVFFRRVEMDADRGAYYEKVNGKWTKTTWREFSHHGAQIAAGLRKLGLKTGDKISILGPTCGKWCELDVGIHMAGLVGIGVYPKQSLDKLAYQIDHSDTKLIFVEGERDLNEVLQACKDNKKLIGVVPWDEKLGQKFKNEKTEIPIILYSEFQKEALSDKEIKDITSNYGNDDVAIMVYTSGTTGMPKGVMLSHFNLLSFAARFPMPFDAFEDDLTLSFLPMAHIAERVISFYGRVTYGMPACFCSDYRYLLQELEEIRPTLFGAVPRIFEKAHAKMFSELAKLPGPLSALFFWAISVGIERVRTWQRGEPIPLSLRLKDLIAETFFFGLLRKKFMGGRIAHIITGAAPISNDILEFFWGIRIPVYEVYGQSEATAVTHLNHDRWGVKLGTVGKQMPGVETKIAEDGEILIKCDWVFKGYYKNESATKECVVDGWLYSGDIGTIDKEGFLKITDRKKHIIITSGGKNIAPASIEKAIKSADPLISQVLPHGDKRPFCSAVIAPGPLETLHWGLKRGIISYELFKKHESELMADPTLRSAGLEADMSKVTFHPDFKAQIKQAVAEGNKKLLGVEQIKAFYILDRDFSQEHGEMTPTMKVKRKDCEAKFKDIFDRLYTDPKFGEHFPVGGD